MQGFREVYRLLSHLSNYRLSLVPFGVFNISRSPRNIEVMDCDQLLLDIRTRPHFGGLAEQYTDLSAADFIKEVSFLLFGFRIVDICDFLRRDTPCD